MYDYDDEYDDLDDYAPYDDLVEDDCEFSGHIWEHAGGGLYMCMMCPAEKWDAITHAEEYPDWQ